MRLAPTLLALGLVLTFATSASAAPHRSSGRHGRRIHSQGTPHRGIHSQSHGGRHSRARNHSQLPRHRGSVKPK